MTRKDKKKQAELWKTAAWDMLYLVQCSVNGLVPDLERVAKMDLAKVYARSKSQSLEAMTYMALENLMEAQPSAKLSDETQVLAKWEEAKNKAIRKTMLMDAARAKLFAFLEEKGIWHVALKGAVLCHMYPEYGMRQMSDNDILFDPAFRQEVHDWFVEQGYTVERFKKSIHDVYQKKPVYNFEMHVSLFDEGAYSQFAQCCLGLKDRMLLLRGKKFEYSMSDEDLYLYMLAHEYKHYSGDGTGLRSLVDLYVYCQAKKDLNWEYLNNSLEKTGLLVFEKKMRKLAEKILTLETTDEELSEDEEIVLKKLIFSTTYGTVERHWNNQLQKLQANGNEISVGVKLQYLMQRLFPDREYIEEWCQKHEPFIAQHQWLMPIAPIWRIVKRGVEKRKQVKKEFDTIRKA